jgi:hypothetical protein
VLGPPLALAQVSQKISQMPSATALGGSELLAGVQSGANVSITPGQIKTYIGAQPSVFPGYVSGNWYMPPFVPLSAGASLTANRIDCVAQLSLAPMTVRTLGAHITTADTGGNVQLAVYANSGISGLPTGTPLGYTASISSGATGVVSAAPVNGAFTLPAGVYWACVNADNGAVVLQSPSGNSTYMSALVGNASQGNISGGNSASAFYLYAAQTFGAWPDLTSASFTPFGSGGAIAAAVIEFQAN